MKLPIILTFALLLLFGSSAVAQEKEIHDPLKKPHLWRQLVDTPENDELWAEYMGKDWKGMTEEDKRYIGKWKAAIALENEPKINYDEFILVLVL